jgi:peptide/nickel transport system substrate-binding protein
MVGDNQPPSSRTGEAVQSQLEKLGFKFDYRQVDRTTTLANSCGSSTAHIAVCPNGGWVKDFFDPQSMLDPVFNGKNISPEASPNWSQVNDPELNAALDLAVSETDPAKRAKAYADIDKTVTGRAYVVMWLWDNQVNIESDDVDGVVSKFNGSWDLPWTSLK